MSKLTKDLLNSPGRYSSDDLLAAATEIRDFLVLYRIMERIFGAGMSVARLEYQHMRSLIETATIVRDRYKND